MTSMIIDAGPLIALLNKDDDDHHLCTRLLGQFPGTLVVPAPIMTEVCYMTGTRLGAEAEAGFPDALRHKELHLESVTDQDLTRMAELVRTFAKQKLGSADASVIAMAERLGTHRVATLNHKDFRQIIPRNNLTLELLPPEHLLARHRR